MKLLLCRRKYGNGLPDSPDLEYSMVPLQLEGLWIYDDHEYLACVSDSDMRMSTNRRLIKMFVGWHSVEIFVLLPWDGPPKFVPRLDWSICWEWGLMLLGTSPSVSAYYSGLMWHGSRADKVHVWQIAITEFLFLVLVPSVPAACEGVFMWKTAEPCIVADNLLVFVPMGDRLTRGIDGLGFRPIVCKMELDPVLAYVTFCRAREGDWSCVDRENQSFLYPWRMVEVIEFAGKQELERKQELDSQLVFHEHRLALLLFVWRMKLGWAGLKMLLQRSRGVWWPDGRANSALVFLWRRLVVHPVRLLGCHLISHKFYPLHDLFF